MLFQNVHGVFKRNMLVMVTDICFCRRCIYRLRQPVRFLQPVWQGNPAHGFVFLVAFPAASGNIAAYNALNWKHVQFFAFHAPSFKLVCLEKFRHIFHICRKHMVWNNAARIAKPEPGHLCQHSPFVRNAVLQNIVKCRNPVCRGNNQAVSIVVYQAYFSFLNRFKF